MRKLKIALSILLLSTISLVAQEKTSKWITDKCTAMKTQIVADLQLTPEEATLYETIIIEKYSADASKVKTLTTDEEKKTYYSEAFKSFTAALKTAFGNEKAQKILQWTKDNQAKFNKPKNQ